MINEYTTENIAYLIYIPSDEKILFTLDYKFDNGNFNCFITTYDITDFENSIKIGV